MRLRHRSLNDSSGLRFLGRELEAMLLCDLDVPGGVDLSVFDAQGVQKLPD